MTTYQNAKQLLKMYSLNTKLEYKNDKPAVRMLINDSVDSISKDFNLSNYQRDLLSNYACKLHP